MASSIKDELKAALDRMPDDWSAEKVYEHLLLYSKLCDRAEQVKRGVSLPYSIVEDKVKQWATPPNPPRRDSRVRGHSRVHRAGLHP